MVSTRCVSIALSVAALCCGTAHSQTPSADAIDRAARHQSEEWAIVSPHLPDPATATPMLLETAGDVLRARRLPEDALDYYQFAITRGGNVPRLMNRIGITELELRRPAAAHLAFRHVLAIDPRNAEAWNNLGATEYSMGNFRAALSDYGRAVKLNKKDAVFHSNLGMAYFEQKDFESARTQFVRATQLDPEVFQRGGVGGVDAHVMSPLNRGRFCLELARLAATNHNEEAMLLWLARATEAGYDIAYDVRTMREFTGYEHDTRIAMLIQNAKTMRSHQIATTNKGPVPALPADAPNVD